MTTGNYPITAGMLLCLSMLCISSCKKENIGNAPGTQTNVGPTVPRVFAGADLTIALPADEVTLSGSVSNATTDLRQVEWRKISGPDFYVIEDKSKLSTRVKGLREGTYAFELSVTNGAGLAGNDTVNVFVVDPNPSSVIVGNNEVTFVNLKWSFPWYSLLEAQKIYTYVPQNKPFNVFVKRDGAANWIEVPSANTTTSDYEYYIYTGTGGSGTSATESLYVMYYKDDAGDTPDVKVTF